MGLLLGFAPFIVFALAEKILGAAPALFSAALTSVALLLRDRLRGQREINLLEAASALMFGVLALWVMWHGSEPWSVWRVRLWVDGGLVLIVLLGMAVGRPFTLAYARRRVSVEVARQPAFLRGNQIVAGAWAVAFAVLTAADLLMVLRPESQTWIAVGLTLGALSAAAWFSRWFPSRAKRRALTRASLRQSKPDDFDSAGGARAADSASSQSDLLKARPAGSAMERRP